MHLDSGYDGKPSRDVLTAHEIVGEIAKKGIPSPIQVGKRWVVERTNSWMNNYGKLRRCTDRNGVIVDFYLHLAATLVTVHCLIQTAPHPPMGHSPHRPTAQNSPLLPEPLSRLAGAAPADRWGDGTGRPFRTF